MSATALVFAVALSATVLLATAVTMAMHISLFWTIQGRGVTVMMGGVVPIFAGLIVPLPLFPDWAQPFLQWQPFRGLADTPFRIYSGNIPLDSAAFEIGLQLGWAALIAAFGYGLLARARSRLVVQGG